MSRTLFAVMLAVAFASAGLLAPALQEKMAQVDGQEQIGVIIALNEQLDAEHIIQTIKNKQERWETTVGSLKTMASSTQAGLLGALRSYEAAGKVSDIQPMWIVNAVYCKATPAVIQSVSDRAEVWFVEWNLVSSPNILNVSAGTSAPADGTDNPEWNVQKVKADSVWHVYGYMGEGVIVGDIDTGCDYTHPDLASHMWTDPNYPHPGWDFAVPDDDPMDEHGHGTHTCGTVASDGTSGDTCGMAPKATIMTVKTDVYIHTPYPDTAAENTVLNAMQFAVAPPLSPSNHADLLTMSLGWIQAWSPSRAVWRAAVTNVAAAGLPFFIANGNEGSSSPPNNCRTPGDNPGPWKHPSEPAGGLGGSISIGATDNSDNIASFSSWGPVSWSGVPPYDDYPYPPGLYKPDFSAPGVDVVSCMLGGGYTTMSGTSMATPCAAGVAALILEKNPNLLPEDVDQIMQNSVLPLGEQPKNNTYGTGRIDAMLCIANTPPPGPTHDVAMGAVLAPADKIDPLAPLAPMVTVRNRGTFDETSITFYCKVESAGTQVYSDQYVLASLDSSATDTVTFPNWNVGPGSQTYDLTFWHTMTPDTNRRNDTIKKSTTTRGHDVAMNGMNVGSRVRANQAFTPIGFVRNVGDYTEASFQTTCKVESAGTQIYLETVAVDSVPLGGTKSVPFPVWNVGPDSVTYVVTMFHDCGPDQNRANDTLSRATMSSSNVMKVAIEIASGSAGRNPPNACYEIQALCEAEGWEDSIVTGSEIDEASELADYSVVVTGDVGYSDNDFATYEGALKDWVRNGGGFVGAGWIVYGIVGADAWQMDSIMAVTCAGGYNYAMSGQVHVIDNSHPVTQGVNDFNIVSYGEYASGGLQPGATMLGDYSDASGQASIAAREVGAGRSVYLGPIYFADFGGYGNGAYYTDVNSRRLLKQAIEWAAWGTSGISGPDLEPAPRAELRGAVPSPFRFRTTISYSLPAAGRARLAIYDLTGKLVKTLVTGNLPAGAGQVTWNRSDDAGKTVARGVYFCRLQADGMNISRKLVVR
jgi:subtilisin family serine protease/type 1 glutamine amidotransferase